MSDDPRLHALLAEDTDDPVPPEHEARIRAGLAAHLAASMPATKPSARALDPDAPPAPPAPSPPQAPTTAAANALGGWKVVGVGVAGLALAGGGFAVGRATAPTQISSASTSPPTPTPTPTPTSAAATAAAGSAPDGASIVTSTSTSTSAAAIAAAGSAPNGASAVTPTSTSPSTSFDREQSLLERARSALLRHDADAAEQALTACAREFPKPKHGEELDYLRILVLRERGDDAAVRERAKAYLAKYPDGLFKSRVEALAR